MHIHLRSLAYLSEVVEAISRAAYIDQMFRLDDVLAHGDLLRQREDVQEHGDVDHVPRASGPGELVLVGEDVACDEVRRTQAVAVLQQRVHGVSEAR